MKQERKINKRSKIGNKFSGNNFREQKKVCAKMSKNCKLISDRFIQ